MCSRVSDVLALIIVLSRYGTKSTCTRIGRCQPSAVSRPVAINRRAVSSSPSTCRQTSAFIMPAARVMSLSLFCCILRRVVMASLLLQHDNANRTDLCSRFPSSRFADPDGSYHLSCVPAQNLVRPESDELVRTRRPAPLAPPAALGILEAPKLDSLIPCPLRRRQTSIPYLPRTRRPLVASRRRAIGCRATGKDELGRRPAPRITPRHDRVRAGAHMDAGEGCGPTLRGRPRSVRPCAMLRGTGSPPVLAAAPEGGYPGNST